MNRKYWDASNITSGTGTKKMEINKWGTVLEKPWNYAFLQYHVAITKK